MHGRLIGGLPYLVLAVATPFFSANSAVAQPGLAQVGLRAAVAEAHQVRQVEAFAEWQLPWSLRLGRGFEAETYVTGGLGWIGDGKNDAPIGSLGPSIRIVHEQLPVAVVAGCAPTVVGRNHWENCNLGCAFQFTSHIGVAWRIVPHVELGYRFQHMSNASLGSDNPGLNSHVIALGWRF